MKPLDAQTSLEQQVLSLLAANLHGMTSPRLRAALKPRISQPTLSRLLTLLRARGLVAKTGAARATRYHLVGGRMGKAELHSRLLHEQVAQKLIRDPALKAQANQRLEFLQKANPSGRIYHERWAELLVSDMPKLLRTMTEDSERASTLRKESPFTALYDPGLRERLLLGRPARKQR